jgi:excisionase family DNA binding protein
MTGQTQPAFRPPSSYVHGINGPCVIVPARVASWLERYCQLNEARITARGKDPEVDNVLNAIRVTAMAWRASATGSTQPAEPEELTPWVGTSEASEELDVTDRAIRHAIKENRLKASNINGRWRIAREDLEHYKAARAA